MNKNTKEWLLEFDYILPRQNAKGLQRIYRELGKKFIDSTDISFIQDDPDLVFVGVGYCDISQRQYILVHIK